MQDNYFQKIKDVLFPTIVSVETPKPVFKEQKLIGYQVVVKYKNNKQYSVFCDWNDERNWTTFPSPDKAAQWHYEQYKKQMERQQRRLNRTK